MKVAATDNAVTALSRCHRCHTNVHVGTSALSLPLLSHNTVLVFTVTTLCTSVSNRCGISPVFCVQEQYDLTFLLDLQFVCDSEHDFRHLLISPTVSLPYASLQCLESKVKF